MTARRRNDEIENMVDPVGIGGGRKCAGCGRTRAKAG
jgi:hypothetical protein